MRIVCVPIMISLLLSAVKVFAQYADNPDKYPSIGISLGYVPQTGDLRATAGVFSATQDAEITQHDITLDFRFPMSNSTTLFGAVSQGNIVVDYTETPLLAGSKTDVSGLGFRIGARFYFNR